MTENKDMPIDRTAEAETEMLRPLDHRGGNLKTHGGKKLLRAAAVCLAVTAVTAMLSVGGSFSKYKSETGEIQLPTLQAGRFNPTVTFDGVKDKVEQEKQKYGLKDTDVVVDAFTVSAGDSEVDISVDVNLHGLSGTVNLGTYEFDPLSGGGTTQIPNEYLSGATYLNSLESSLIVGTLDDGGNFTKLDKQPTPVPEPASAPAAFDAPEYDVMPVASMTMPFIVSAEYSNEWQDAFTIPSNDTKKYVVIVVIETEITIEGLDGYEYKGPSVSLAGNSNNLTVTVNQAQSKN